MLNKEFREKKASQHIVVFSTEWAKRTALQYLCGKWKTGENIPVETISDVMVLFSRLSKSYPHDPGILVLDIPPRDHIGLLCHIRRRYPVLPVIITQSRILFSDRAVASWFGNIWLREYDSLMAGYPDSLISDCVTDLRFSDTNSSPACAEKCRGGESNVQVLDCMERWLSGRLIERMGSERCARVVTEWLSRGMSPRDTGNKLQRSDKLIYHYRGQVIRALDITGHPRDFFPSLTLKVGPVERNDLVPCRVRVTR